MLEVLGRERVVARMREAAERFARGGAGKILDRINKIFGTIRIPVGISGGRFAFVNLNPKNPANHLNPVNPV